VSDHLVKSEGEKNL